MLRRNSIIISSISFMPLTNCASNCVMCIFPRVINFHGKFFRIRPALYIIIFLNAHLTPGQNKSFALYSHMNIYRNSIVLQLAWVLINGIRSAQTFYTTTPPLPCFVSTFLTFRILTRYRICKIRIKWGYLCKRKSKSNTIHCNPRIISVIPWMIHWFI